MTAETHDHVHLFDAGPRAEDLARCVHCGFCLQACPTYVITSLETESPRGRIALARAV
ncbi:MAG TPA: 4Fe-4S dicluster domain-containing protein, partial [Dehalococcoidia bacterium]|nr:4Fe-4S dicluster domain-containing protein [Dehalococcoidia bacterium]